MAVGTSNGNQTFYSIAKHKIRTRVSDGTDRSEVRKLKNGKEVSELCYDFMEGVVNGIEVENHSEYGLQLKITIDEDLLTLSFNSKYAKKFMDVLANIDSDKPVQLKVWEDRKNLDKEGNPTTAFNVLQGGSSLKHSYTKDDPNGRPAPKEKTVAGSTTWDWTDQTNFYYEKTIEEAKRFGFKNMLDTAEKKSDEDLAKKQPGFDGDESISAEDLPFN